jgi:hypothetical protein
MTRTKVIWFDVNLDKWEYDWLSELFKDAEVEVIVTNTFDNLPPLEDCVVVCNHAVNYRAYLDALRQNGKRYGVILLSDENLREPMEYLHDPNCAFVARNYFHPFYHRHPKLTVFGLGYKKGFSECSTEIKKFEDRKYDWCFAGSLHDDMRRSAVEQLKSYSTNFKTHFCSGFNAADGLSTEEYRELLNNSKFALCPQGQDSMDSFRIYEALEAGAIPITLKHTEQIKVEPSYWHAVFFGTEKIPFVIENDWADVVKRIKKEGSSEMQEKCISFWNQWKQDWRSKFRTLITRI